MAKLEIRQFSYKLFLGLRGFNGVSILAGRRDTVDRPTGISFPHFLDFLIFVCYLSLGLGLKGPLIDR
jgi:hypothetical protein